MAAKSQCQSGRDVLRGRGKSELDVLQGGRQELGLRGCRIGGDYECHAAQHSQRRREANICLGTLTNQT